jgi:PAS domain S-box-containing protein
MNEKMRAVRVLVVEDNADDAELLERELKGCGFQPTALRVETLARLEEELRTEQWELIISDYQLVGFTALEALQTLKASGCDIPFLIVSGSIGEETAVHIMRAGAHDFFLKDRLQRLGTVIDRELREAAIRRERRAVTTLLDNLYETAPVGLAFYDRDFRYVRINESLAAINGVPAADHIGRRVREVLPSLGSGIEEKLRTVMTTGKPLYNIELTGETRAAPGTLRHWLVNYYPVWEKGGALLGMGSIVVDVTDTKRAEQDRKRAGEERERMLAEVTQALRSRDEFLSIASHELKTPITALELQIASSLKVIRERGSSGLPVQKLVAKLEGASRQTTRLTALVNNLLDVARITSGPLAISPREVDLREIVRGVLTRHQELIERSQAQVTVDAVTPVVGRWDSAALETVVGNLVSNAIKYGEGKPIRITVRVEAGNARLMVSDEGVGIANGDQARIFERFERAVPSEHYGGFGLGLWIARNIVEAHGGSIRVTSEEGVGSTFTVELPLRVGEVGA